MATPAQKTGSEEGQPHLLVGIDLGGTAAKLGLLRCDALAAAVSTGSSGGRSSSNIEGLVIHSVRAPLPAHQADRCVLFN